MSVSVTEIQRQGLYNTVLIWSKENCDQPRPPFMFSAPGGAGVDVVSIEEDAAKIRGLRSASGSSDPKANSLPRGSCCLKSETSGFLKGVSGDVRLGHFEKIVRNTV